MFGARATDNVPCAPSMTLFVPAATGLPSAVVNAGHEISSVPAAGVPSARYTTSLIVVIAGACARDTAVNNNTDSST